MVYYKPDFNIVYIGNSKSGEYTNTKSGQQEDNIGGLGAKFYKIIAKNKLEIDS